MDTTKLTAGDRIGIIYYGVHGYCPARSSFGVVEKISHAGNRITLTDGATFNRHGKKIEYDRKPHNYGYELMSAADLEYQIESETHYRNVTSKVAAFGERVNEIIRGNRTGNGKQYAITTAERNELQRMLAEMPTRSEIEC